MLSSALSPSFCVQLTLLPVRNTQIFVIRAEIGTFLKRHRVGSKSIVRKSIEASALGPALLMVEDDGISRDGVLDSGSVDRSQTRQAK